MNDDLKKFSDDAEAKIDAATGIKGSDGSWASRHPGVIIAVGVAVVMLLAFLSAVSHG